MSLISPLFLIFATTLVLAYHFHESARYRMLVLTIGDTLFLLSYVNKPEQLIPLSIFLLMGYALVLCAQRYSASWALASSVGLTVVVYIFLKQFSFLPEFAKLPFPYLTIGLSYILFRILHLIIDAAEGNLEEHVSPGAFFRYSCNFLSFVSGPIQTYQGFRKDTVADAVLTEATVFASVSRIVTGYIKFAVIAASADYVFDNAHGQLGASHPLLQVIATYVVCVVAYTLYLYFNFSGYMDIVIGIGRLLGQDLPENFDRPFRSASFLEFWQRWHMTLSAWFKTYLFNPLLMAMMMRVETAAAAPLLGVIAFFVTFLVMGVWHGTTFVFVIYGLLMGAGASINKLWQIAILQALGRTRNKALKQSVFYLALCRGLTFSYFALALTCLWTPELGDLVALCRRLGPTGLIGTFLILTVGAALVTSLIELLMALRARSEEKRSAGDASRSWTRIVVTNFSLAARIGLVLIVVSTLNKSPEFVYKAF